jgi:hypothetical protein
MNSNDIIDIADLDVVYLSYDEPQKEEFWLKIKNMVPWAKRVDGVKGSDAAHKAAGEMSDTDRFILIDGDNLPEESFFNLQLDFTGKDDKFKNGAALTVPSAFKIRIKPPFCTTNNLESPAFVISTGLTKPVPKDCKEMV